MSDLSTTPLRAKADGIGRRRWNTEIRRGASIAGLFFVGLLGLAAITPLDAGATAQGVVAVSGSRQLVQHREGGILTDLPVVEGQAVSEGQLLAQVSQSSLTASERSLTGEYLTLLAQRQRLQAQLAGASFVREPPEFAALSPGDREIAAEALAGQRQLLLAQVRSLGAQRQVLSQRALQSRAGIAASQFQMTANREQKRLLGEELSGMQELVGRGFVSKNRIREMQRAQAQLDGDFGALDSDVARSRQAIGEMQMQIASLERQKVEDAAAQLREVQLRLAETQPKLVAAREELERSRIKAPVSGHVVDLKVHTVGGVIGSGETLMQIVPDRRELVIAARTSPTDVDALRVGMAAQVHFGSLHDRSLPTLVGSISKLSADSLEDERTGARYFTIEVTVPSSELDKVRKIHGEMAIRAGIPAEVMIPLRKRTALHYLLDPLINTFWLSGRER